MKILGIDTSSDILSICISENNVILGECYIKNVNNHSPKLVPMVDDLLKKLELDISNIDLFACSIGPGSFTGLRIGLAFMKSMAQANNKPIIGVVTLHSLAFNSHKDIFTCPIIDAKNDNIYTCVFDDEQNLKLEYTSLEINELLNICKKSKKAIYFLGNGAILHKDLIIKSLPKKKIYDIQDAYLTAKNICLIAYNKYLNNEIDDIFALNPLYLKPSQAERFCKNG